MWESELVSMHEGSEGVEKARVVPSPIAYLPERVSIDDVAVSHSACLTRVAISRSSLCPTFKYF